MQSCGAHWSCAAVALAVGGQGRLAGRQLRAVEPITFHETTPSASVGQMSWCPSQDPPSRHTQIRSCTMRTRRPPDHPPPECPLCASPVALSQCDMVVSEILDSHLIGEGVLPSLRDARERLLMPSAPTVPYSATIFGRLIQSPSVRAMHNLAGSAAVRVPCSRAAGPGGRARRVSRVGRTRPSAEVKARGRPTAAPAPPPPPGPFCRVYTPHRTVLPCGSFMCRCHDPPPIER